MATLFGAIAMSLSLILVFVGLTAQIYKNYRRKSCEGLSLTLMITVLGANIAWTLYGLSKADWFLVGAQLPGGVFALVIVIQYVLYKKRN